MLVRQISEVPIQFCVIAAAEDAARISSMWVGHHPDFHIKIWNLFTSKRRNRLTFIVT
jgi:hypothetical protein